MLPLRQYTTFCTAVALALLGLSSCSASGSDSSGGGSASGQGFVASGTPGTWEGGSAVPASYDAPYGVITGNTRTTLRGNVPFANSKRFFLAVTRNRTIGGVTFHDMTGAWSIAGPEELTPTSTKAITVTLARPTPLSIQLAEVKRPDFVDVKFEPPMTFTMDKPVGEKVTYTGAATFQLKATDPVVPGTGKLDLTVVETNATVQTDEGTVTGTRHLAGTLTVSGDSIPALVRDVPITGDLWVHADLGVVKAVVPGLGVGVGWEGAHDCAKASGTDLATCRGMSVLDGTVTAFRLSTKDRAGVADADKMQHAQMLVEMRYANESDALTQTSMPPVQLQVADSYGTFGANWVQSPISYFHPQELGKGYKYWNAYVSQADKYQPGANGIEYYVDVQRGSATLPVRVTARLLYHLAP